MFERIKRKFGRLLGALAFWIGAGLCIFVLAGGILIYLFGAVLGIVGIILAILGLAILAD